MRKGFFTVSTLEGFFSIVNSHVCFVGTFISKFLVTNMLLLGFLMLLRIFEANTTLIDATLFKLCQLER